MKIFEVFGVRLAALGFCILLLMTTMLSSATMAGQFRSFNPIDKAQRVPHGFQLVDTVTPLNQELIEHAIRLVASKFRTPELRNFLSERFVNADRLVDEIQSNLPFDSVLRITAIRGTQILTQYARTTEKGHTELQSMVSAVVSSQLEVSDPVGGLQVFENTSEWLVELNVLEAKLTGGDRQ